MKNIFPTRQSVFYAVFAATAIMVLFMSPRSHATTLEELRAALPKNVMGWSLESKDHIYTPETIFDYINGGAEVYRAYNMQQCLSRRYATTQGPAIVLDIFDMGSSQDAFGVYTHDTEGDAVDIGQDARWRPGWLNFWKGRFFVSIYMEEENTAAEKAVKALGKLVDCAITPRGARPKIINRLPPEGLLTMNIRYLHHPVILNYHYYLSDENLLKLSPRTEAVLAGYRRENGQALILLVSYPDTNAAIRASANFNRHYLADADQNGMALLENQKWSASKINGRLLVIILEADSRLLAESLLDAVK
ncbi:hypothetical protein D1BOALGB6SA_6299 [Olavius sp. associated proteobacterium Delta 1]|nr:hypothetical protein D1BOALGB6SA_6299 [Olavius sp. associated proteobacterium Delta 1]